MAYKYESILKTFSYSKESYKIISDFLLSGDITNPNILLKVNEITKAFRPNHQPRDWFRISTTREYILALLNIKLEAGNTKFEKIIRKWIKAENIDKEILNSIRSNNPNGINTDKTTLLSFEDSSNKILDKNYFIINSELFINIEDKKLMKLLKELGLVTAKRGGDNRNLIGTWLHKDLSIEYARWLDAKFSIWISQKILELVSDGVAWNEIRAITKMDYKPLILAIEKYVMPKYPNMDENILKGQIANYINLRVMGQKAKEIRAEKKIEDDELTRDFFEKLQLKQIEEVQVFAKTLIVQLDIYDFKTLEDKISKYKFE